MIDSHVHLDASQFDDDRDEVIARALEAGLEAVINIGIDVESSRSSIALSQAREGSLPIFVAVGVHPQSPIDDLDAAIVEIEKLARENLGRVVAIGEIGLDFHWDTVTREDQLPRLERQLDLAIDLDLPVIYHCRDAIDELLALLESRERIPAGVFHCFEGGADEARRALDLGYRISFAGNVTYKNATRLKDAARFVPSDQILLETDCPYLAPVPRRGKRNEPAFAVFTRDYLAELKGMETQELGRRARETTVRLFELGL
jgi:TatD DNase family protein